MTILGTDVSIDDDKIKLECIIYSVANNDDEKETIKKIKSLVIADDLFIYRDDRFLATVGNYRKPIVTIWYANNFTRLLNWHDENSNQLNLNTKFFN